MVWRTASLFLQPKNSWSMQEPKDNIGQLRKRLQDCEALILRLTKSFLLDEIFVG